MVEKLNGMPEAYAEIEGIAEYPDIHGMVYFFDVYDGTILMVEIYGLPDEENPEKGQFFGFHIHEGATCTGDAQDPLKDTGGHFNPDNAEHPNHAGDLPPLLSVNGAAWMAVYTGRFHPEDVIGRTAVIHLHPDDFHTQPSGDSGMKIACGEIREQMVRPGETGPGNIARNLNRNMDRDMGRSMDRDMDRNTDRDMGRNMGRSMDRNTDRNVDGDMGRNMDRNMGTTVESR